MVLVPTAFNTLTHGYRTDKLGFLKINKILLSAEVLDLRLLTGELWCVVGKVSDGHLMTQALYKPFTLQ